MLTNSTRLRTLAPALFAAGCLVPMASAATLFVPADYATIQDAVDASVDGDEIILSSMIFNEDVTVSNKKLTIRSGANNPNACIINAGFFGLFVIGADADVELRGIRIRNGNRGVEINGDASATIRNCQIRNNSNIGGLFMNGTRLEMHNTEVSGNSATNVGGGLFISSGHVLLANCDIFDNDVTGANAFGGGVYAALADSLTIVGCTITGNSAIGTTDGEGGGLWASAIDALTVSDTVFDGNTAGTLGGGAFIEFSDVVFSNVTATDNVSEGGGGVFLQNDLSPEDRLARFSNCLFARNDGGAGSGGGLRIGTNYDVVVTNATIFSNTAGSGGGVANGPDSESSFTNCIVGGNSPGDFGGLGATTVTYSNVEDGFVGEGNISELPLLVDVAGGDYRLTAASPMIDAGNTAAYTGFALDLDGLERSVDDPAVENTGIAMLSSVIDMGCYEFQPEPEPNGCPADFTGPAATPDGNVDALDFLALIASWGNPGCP